MSFDATIPFVNVETITLGLSHLLGRVDWPRRPTRQSAGYVCPHALKVRTLGGTLDG